jgi:cytochrome P450
VCYKSDKWIEINAESEKKKEIAKYTQFIQHQIERFDKDNRESDRQDFLTYLRAQKTKDDRPLPEKDLINHMTNNMYVLSESSLFIYSSNKNHSFAGSDTTAITLRTIFHRVLQTPRIYSKLMQEIDALPDTSANITYEEGSKMPYLY